jgi:hypothetical protein
MRGRISLRSTTPEDLQRSRLEAKDEEVALVDGGGGHKLIVSSAELVGDDPASPDAGRTVLRVPQGTFETSCWVACLSSAVKAPSEGASPGLQQAGGWYIGVYASVVCSERKTGQAALALPVVMPFIHSLIYYFLLYLMHWQPVAGNTPALSERVGFAQNKKRKKGETRGVG